MVDYTYDAAGNIVQAVRRTNPAGTGLVTTYRDTYSYANGKLLVHLGQNTGDGGATWVNDVVDTFRYTGNNLTFNAYYSWDELSATWSDGYRTASYYNAQNNLDSELVAHVVNGAASPDSKNKYTYNGYGHYSRIVSYFYRGTGYSTVPDITYDFYYELFTPSAIAPVVKEQDLAVLYPNPAAEMLNIRYKAAGLQGAGLCIYNALGQLVQAAATGSSTGQQIDISRLAPGSYTLEVKARGDAVQRLKFSKR